MNGSLHACPTSGPEPGPEDTTEIKEDFALSELTAGRAADGWVNSET